MIDDYNELTMMNNDNNFFSFFVFGCFISLFFARFSPHFSLSRMTISLIQLGI